MSSLLIKKMTVCLAAALFLTSLYGQNNMESSIEFTKQVHDFGDILQSAGKQSCTFTFKNISKQPVVVQTVISSCGCTTPTWTKSPLKPGESGKISVTFLNDQGPYPFDKSLTVYVTGSTKPVILRIKGIVHEKKKNLRQLFPETFSLMAMRKSPIDLGQIAQGSVVRETTEIANISKTPIKVTFAELTKGLTLNVSPATIEPGGRGIIEIEIDTKVQENWGFTAFNAIPVINGKRIARTLTFQVSIREDFSNLTKEDVDMASLPMATSSSYTFGKIKTGKNIETAFEIKNLGKKDLIIHKIDASETGVTTKFPSKIAPGSKGRVSVSVNTTDHYGEIIYILSLFTNSPSRPIVNFIVTGEITK